MTKKKERLRGIIERRPPIPLAKKTKTKREQIDANDKKRKGHGWDAE